MWCDTDGMEVRRSTCDENRWKRNARKPWTEKRDGGKRVDRSGTEGWNVSLRVRAWNETSTSAKVERSTRSTDPRSRRRSKSNALRLAADPVDGGFFVLERKGLGLWKLRSCRRIRGFDRTWHRTLGYSD
uniref:Uncharacterized protein n=1 Tax=Picocystis salinarum TaxID=88271 RepID=A0A7S3UAV7_9CHLO